MFNGATNFYNLNNENFHDFLMEMYRKIDLLDKDTNYIRNHLIDELRKELRKIIANGELIVDIESVVDDFLRNGLEENKVVTDIKKKLEEFSSHLDNIKTKINFKNIRTVAKSGGEYNTIMEAVNVGGDTTENPITIQLYPGTYEEQVYIKQWTRINLVGTNKKDCIVVNHNGGYTDETLITAGERYIANITFKATHEKSTTGDKSLWKSYAFHGDKSSGGDGTTLIENCRFESYHNASVGLGIYNNQKFHFKGCEFYSKIDYDSPQANVGAFFAHNSVNGGSTNGELILENCTFFMDNDRAGYGHACYINDANLTNGDGTGKSINVKFINCTLKRKFGEHVNAIRLDNTTSINNLSGSITLDKTSNGNNIPQLNFPQLIWNEVTLIPPIANVGSNFTPLRYSKDVTGLVRIEGTIKGLTTGVTNTLFTLPVGYRPKYHKFYDVVNYNGGVAQIGKILINRNGTVTIEGTLNDNRNDIIIEFYAEQ